MASIRTQGTQLWFVDLTSSSVASIVQMTCPTGITGLGGTADSIDDTCLDATEKSFVKGTATPGVLTVPFIIKSPAPVSHTLLFDLKDSGDDIPWMIGLSDGTNSPTLDGNDEFIAPTGRTSFGFHGFISDITIDIATNEVVRGTLTIQRSGLVVATWV